MYIVPKIEVREAEDIADFATTMDSDMNQYFEEKKTLLEDIPRGENPGTAYYSFYPAVINPKLFYAYILAIKYFQDGTCRWKLCLTSRENEECHMTLSIEGQLDIFSADESGNDVHEWSGFVTKIPGFLAGEKVYRVVHEYDDEFRFNVTETIAICTTEQKADEIVEENKKDGLDENESYWSLVEELEG